MRCGLPVVVPLKTRDLTIWPTLACTAAAASAAERVLAGIVRTSIWRPRACAAATTRFDAAGSSIIPPSLFRNPGHPYGAPRLFFPVPAAPPALLATFLGPG